MTVIVITFWAALAVALHAYGPALAQATGWRWPAGRNRILIGAGLVWLALLVVGGAVVLVLAGLNL